MTTEILTGYVAVCEHCDWVGPSRPDSLQALNDSDAHYCLRRVAVDAAVFVANGATPSEAVDWALETAGELVEAPGQMGLGL